MEQHKQEFLKKVKQNGEWNGFDGVLIAEWLRKYDEMWGRAIPYRRGHERYFDTILIIESEHPASLYLDLLATRCRADEVQLISIDGLAEMGVDYRLRERGDLEYVAAKQVKMDEILDGLQLKLSPDLKVWRWWWD